MTIVTAGTHLTVAVAIGQALNVSATTGTGHAVRLANPTGGEPYPPVALDGSAKSIGPFGDVALFRVSCTTGQIAFTIDSVSGAPTTSRYSKTVTEGRRSTIYVPAGATLTIAANAGSSGSFNEVTVGGEPGSPVPFTGAAITVGPFISLKIYRVRCDVGSISMETAAIASSGGGVTPALTPFAYDAATQTALTAFTAAGATMVSSLSRQLDRMYRRLKGENLLSLWDAIQLPAPNEAIFQTNLAKPGTNNLAKVGAPTFLANDGVTTASAADYYDIDLTLADMSPTAHSFFVYVRTPAAANSNDAGARQAGGSGISILTQNASAQMSFQSLAAAGVTGSASGAPWGGSGWFGGVRTSGTSVDLSHTGIRQQTSTSTALTTLNTTERIRLLGVVNNTAFSTRKLGGWAISKNTALTDVQKFRFHAITEEYINSVVYGAPYVEEKGIGTATITADVIIYGLTAASIFAAYEAKRQGRTVALVGDFLDENLTHMGGMLAAGLGYADCKNFTAWSGLIRQATKWINLTYYGRSDTVDQVGVSAESRAWNACFRRMCDPRFASDPILPGLDIPIYMTGGMTSVNKASGKITNIQTADGRTFNGQQFIFGDYEGDGVYYSGAPYVIGRESSATYNESSNGYQAFGSGVAPWVGFNHNNVDSVRPDPYVTLGVSASGKLPDMVDEPTYTQGQAEPALQTMNKRLMVSTSKQRMLPWSLVFAAGAPRNYNALRYELLVRTCALVNSASAGARDYDFPNDIATPQTVFTAVLDVNSGNGGFATDLPQSGLNYALAGANVAMRKAIIADYDDYLLGMFYFILFSGDSRIPASLIAYVNTIGFDARHFLDPGSNGQWFLQDRIYAREPTFQLNNAGFKLTGADITRGQGNLRSIKTIAFAGYRTDVHSLRVATHNDGGGMTVYRQGGVAGSNINIAVAIESIQPDKAVATNMHVVGFQSASKPFHSNSRMEFTLSMSGQSAGMAAAKAIEDGVAVQDLDYPTLRTRLLGAPDTTVLYLPQS